MNRITVFHYHLLPGGVTNVILLGAIALIRNLPNLQLLRIVCGREENTDTVRIKIQKEIDASGLLPDSFCFEICIEPEIDYHEFQKHLTDKEIKNLTNRLTDRFGDSIWWIHNYQLGKNPLFTAAVLNIAEQYPEQKMLLQIHDFPECARYSNLEKLYSAGVGNPYPVSNNVIYCLINSRDEAILKRTGIPEEKIFLLNNPVEDKTFKPVTPRHAELLKSSYYKHFSRQFPKVNPDAKMIFYPVRTIRRKNVLEAGLITAISEVPVNLVVSLPGISQQEKKYSDLCEKCFKNGLIPGIWGSGVSEPPAVPTYPQMFQICDLVISSSVQEGFGYLFINSVQQGIPLTARDLDILNGIRAVFPENKTNFYSKLPVPINKSDAETLKLRYHKKLKNLSDYITAETLTIIQDKTDKLTDEGIIDFSYLPVELQIKTLKNVKDSKLFSSEIRVLNQELMKKIYNQLEHGKYHTSIRMDDFSLEAHSFTVERIIDRLYSSKTNERKPQINVQQKLLDSFAEPEYMRLLYDY